MADGETIDQGTREIEIKNSRAGNDAPTFNTIYILDREFNVILRVN